ncbi:MAG: hypothetical protein Q9190_000309 [Brigantiaea leucoxantha]
MEALSTEALSGNRSLFTGYADPLEPSENIIHLRQEPRLEACNPPWQATPIAASVPADLAWLESDTLISTIESESIRSSLPKTVITIENLDAATRAAIVDMVLEKKGHISISTG